MASGGNSTSSLECGHDSFSDYPCSLCEEEGQGVAATKFCKECYVYMCDKCVTTKHDKFPLNKRHKMVNQSQFSTVQESALRSYPTKRCAKHPGELINMYCGVHDVVCCFVCKTLEHSNCKNSQHLPHAAKGINTSHEYQNVMKEAESFISNADRLLKERKSDISKIGNDKQHVKKVVAEFHKRVNKYFEDLEKKCLDELGAKEEKIIREIEEDLKYLDSTRFEAKECLQQLESFRGDNECELFVHVKDGKRLLSDANKKVMTISNSAPQECLYYELNAEIEEYLKSLETMGSFDKTPVTDQYISNTSPAIKEEKLPSKTSSGLFHYKPTLSEQRLMFDEEGSYNFEMCLLSDGTILSISDSSNELSRLNHAYEELDSIKLPGTLLSVCAAGDTEVIVLCKSATMAKKNVVFVAVQQKLILKKTFGISEFASNGMVYSNKTLYVCCREESDGIAGRIAVYSELGQLEHYIPQSPVYLPYAPEHIILSADGQHLFVTNSDSNTLTMLDLSGNVMDAFNTLHAPGKMCTNGQDNMFVCLDDKKVVQVSYKHQTVQEVLTEKDGLEYMSALCYDRKTSRLMVACVPGYFNDYDWYTRCTCFTYTLK